MHYLEPDNYINVQMIVKLTPNLMIFYGIAVKLLNSMSHRKNTFGIPG